MPVCPWCQAQVSDPRFPCRACGRRPKDHVSYQRLAAVQVAAHPEAIAPPPTAPAVPSTVKPAAASLGELDFAPAAVPARPVPPAYGEVDLAAPAAAPVEEAVPDLVFEARRGPVAPDPAAAPEASSSEVPSFAPPPIKPPPKKVAVSAPVAGSFDELDMMPNDYGAIDLAGESPGGTAPAAPESRELAAAPPPAVSSLLQSDDGGKAAAERLGQFGPVPEAWWKTPVYAYRVTMRQMELRRALAECRANLVAAQDATDTALASFAERGRKLVAQHEAYAKLLVGVVASEHSLRQRDTALAAETDAHAQKVAGIDARITQGEAELAGAKAEQKSYDDVFARVDAIRQRAEAKVKRVDIELRAAVARATPAGVPGATAAPEDVSAAVAACTAERAARVAEVEQATPAVTEAAQKLTAAKRKVATVEQALLAAKNERAALDIAFKKRGASQGVEVAAAQKGVRSALAAMGRAMAGDYHTFGDDWAPARAEIAALEKVTSAKDDQVMLHVMAIDAHDRTKVRTGLGLAAGAVLLLFVLALLPLFFRTPPPPPHTTIDLTQQH